MKESNEVIKFGAAMEELDRLLREIEAEDGDLDHLTERVERAAQLIRICRGKIEKTELQVKQIIDDLEPAGE